MHLQAGTTKFPIQGRSVIYVEVATTDNKLATISGILENPTTKRLER